jgi:hypothetical protein
MTFSLVPSIFECGNFRVCFVKADFFHTWLVGLKPCLSSWKSASADWVDQPAGAALTVRLFAHRVALRNLHNQMSDLIVNVHEQIRQV